MSGSICTAVAETAELEVRLWVGVLNLSSQGVPLWANSLSLFPLSAEHILTVPMVELFQVSSMTRLREVVVDTNWYFFSEGNRSLILSQLKGEWGGNIENIAKSFKEFCCESEQREGTVAERDQGGISWTSLLE